MTRLVFIILISSFVFFALAQEHVFPPENMNFKFHRINKLLYTKTNFGNTRSNIMVPGLTGEYSTLEVVFPQGSINAFKLASGFWFGAVVGSDTLVTTSAGYEYTGLHRGHTVETYPDFSENDTIYHASSLYTQPPIGKDAIDCRNFFDSNGLLHSEYYPVSHEDLICQYYDNKIFHYAAEAPEILKDHTPLNMHIIERSMAWDHPSYNQTIFLQYLVINEGKNIWKDACFALVQNPNIGTIEKMELRNDYIYYNFDQQALILANAPWGDDRFANDERIGMVILGGSFDNENLDPKYMFHQWQYGYYDASTDKDRYKKIISNKIGVMGSPEYSGHQKGMLGYGPLGNIDIGDTLEIFVALIGGKGESDLLNRIQKARSVYATHFRLPSPPNPPQFELIPGNHSVTIDWSWKEKYYDKGFPPEESYDISRGDSLFYDFEGYRIYKSSTGENGPWQMIAEYDSLNSYGYDIGLKFQYTDNGLVNGMTYHYAVTAFDRQDFISGEESMESPKFVSQHFTVPGPILDNNNFDTKPYAVPNPYCSDKDYTTDPKWESSTSFGRTTWYEIDRNIAFMNIPDVCNIKIFTIDGTLVNSIDHNKTITGNSVAKWNLLNNNNHTVGSGIYYFVVKDKQSNKSYINKFVIVK